MNGETRYICLNCKYPQSIEELIHEVTITQTDIIAIFKGKPVVQISEILKCKICGTINFIACKPEQEEPKY